MKRAHAAALLLSAFGFVANASAQTLIENPTNLKVVSSAPVSYRVNKKVGTKSVLHGYYKKGYNLTIYGDSSAIGFRADCDKCDDWSGAKVEGTTQDKNSFEGRMKCRFNPHELYGTVLPGGKGMNHYEGTKKLGVSDGDLTITYRVDKSGKTIDSVIGVVFDRGPHNQPGESSVKARRDLGGNTDNNEYIYVVFPNTARHLKEVIGVKSGDSLKRDPTQADMQQAYALMNRQQSASARKATKEALLSALSTIPIMNNFDFATPEEKAKALQQAPNDNRNLNE